MPDALSFSQAMILTDAEQIGRAALEAGLPIELARIAAENCATYPLVVERIRELLGFDDLSLALAMMGPREFVDGLIARGGPGEAG